MGDALTLPKIVQEVKHGDRGSFSKRKHKNKKQIVMKGEEEVLWGVTR